MEDDPKILKVVYLSNHWLDLTKIWNFRLDDHFKLQFNWRWRTMEDDLPREEYLRNHWSYLIQSWNLSLDDQTTLKTALDEDDIQNIIRCYNL